MRALLAVIAALIGLTAATRLIAAAPRPSAGEGYLSAGQRFAALAGLDPPPAAGSLEAAQDLQIWRRTRALLDSSRWAIAQDDAGNAPDGGARLFDCVLGARLEAPQSPAVLRLLTRISADAVATLEIARARHDRARPNASQPGPFCRVISPRFPRAGGWPSAPAVIAEAWGRAIAAAVPDRAQATLARARAAGESAAICGVNWASDVRAGLKLGDQIAALESSSGAYQSDLAAAARAIAEARRAGLSNPRCAAEAEALAPDRSGVTR